MSLFLKERIEEQKEEDPENDKIVFTYPWILPSAIDLDANNYMRREFVTIYGAESTTWCVCFSNNWIKVSTDRFDDGESSRIWNGTCFVSYNIFYDNEMRFLFHSSPTVKMTETPNDDEFKTPDGFMTKIVEAIQKRIPQQMVIFIELHLPTKYFFRPFEKPGSKLCKSSCDEYPVDLKTDYRFGFLNKSDYIIKCPDGSIPCRRIMLNLTSEFMKKHLKESKDVELIVEHSIDVVKPVIHFLHSLCFKMPKCYDLNFADRLLKAVNFFNPVQISDIKLSIHQSLCQKFVTELQDFDSILRWTSISCQHSLHCLRKMVTSVIIQKYYFKWQQTFPENVRNTENPLFRHIFGSGGDTWQMFERADEIYAESLLTNVILQ